MARQLISQRSHFEREIGSSRAVVEGDTIYVSDATGFNYTTMHIAEDVAEQAGQCLRNIDWALTQAGASFADILRVCYILPNAGEFPACWPVLRA